MSLQGYLSSTPTDVELYTDLITIAKCPHFLALLHVEQSQSWCLNRIEITLQVSQRSTIHLIKLCSVPICPIVEHGIQNDDAHDVLVEVKAQLVELARPSVEHHGVEVDRPQVDELHELPSDLAEW